MNFVFNNETLNKLSNQIEWKKFLNSAKLVFLVQPPNQELWSNHDLEHYDLNTIFKSGNLFNLFSNTNHLYLVRIFVALWHFLKNL